MMASMPSSSRMETLPILGLLLGGLASESLEVGVHEEANGDTQSHDKILVTRVRYFVHEELHSFHLSPGGVRGGTVSHTCFQARNPALRLLLLHGLHHATHLIELM